MEHFLRVMCTHKDKKDKKTIERKKGKKTKKKERSRKRGEDLFGKLYQYGFDQINQKNIWPVALKKQPNILSLIVAVLLSGSQ